MKFGVVLALALAPALVQRPADTLPAKLTDTQFWRMIADFSEVGGSFPYENFVSNEVNYQSVIPDVKRQIKPGGVYLGVAPEQNFTYIAAVQPKMAFIFDIRRQNLIELLMYKALFEMSPDRADFVAKLFSRKRPAGLTTTSSARAIFDAFVAVQPDKQLYTETLQAMKDCLIKQHQFTLTREDESKIDYIFNVFFRGGPRMDYGFASASPNSFVPSYYNLMVSTDRTGKNWAYLADEENYRFVRTMQQMNLIVPIIGDFAGPKAIKAVAKYLQDRNAEVTVFYISNVEDYLNTSWAAYKSNLESLPVETSGLFIRFAPQITHLRSIKDIPARWPGRTW